MGQRNRGTDKQKFSNAKRKTMNKNLIIGMTILAYASPALAGNVPTTYVNKDRLDRLGGGSGVVIASHEVLTANHVVDGCTAINVFGHDAYVAAHDEGNDLAVVHTKDQWATWGLFSNEPVLAGDTAIAMGYPLAGVLADTASVSVGYVSALAGPFNDSRFQQITTPIQPGNSGGGLFDGNGGIIGIVQSKLVKDVLENVNFAIKSEVARAFLDSNNVKYQMSPHLGKKLSPTEVAAMARPFTVRIECYGKQDQVAKSESQPAQQPAPPPQLSPPQQPPGPPPSVSAAPKHSFRITNDLNLRSGPGASFQQIASIPEGSTVLVGRCVKPEGLLPFCELEWQGKNGWASSCCMA
jgi:hypothetical protein